MKRFLIIVAGFLFIISLHAQQNGSFDKTYGSNGIVITHVKNYSGAALASAIQQDNKIVISGGVSDTIIDGEETSKPLLQRYNTDGSLDESFGESGSVAITLFNGYLDFGKFWNLIAIQPDGRMITSATLYKTNLKLPESYFNMDADIALARFKPDGTLDSSFGINGISITDLGKDELANAIALQKDGKIVITGGSRNGIFGNSSVLTLRYNEDGTLDKSFNETGYNIYPYITNEGFALAIQEDGKILSGGVYNIPERFLLIRYLPDGRRDSSFATNSRAITTLGDAYTTRIHSLALQKDGSIVAAGLGGPEFADDYMAVVHYTAKGAVDSSFGDKGKVFVGGNHSGVTKAFLTADGKILLTGNGYSNNEKEHENFTLVRLQPDGAIDSSFGEEGKVSEDLGLDLEDEASGAVMQTDGKVVITGSSYSNSGPTNNNISLARYNTSGEGQRPIVARIKRFLHNQGIGWNSAGNASYYSVESGSPAGFREVAWVRSSAGQPDYTYVIPSTSAGDRVAATDYYRVRAVSSSGQSLATSNLVAVSADNTANTASVFPNPASSSITVQGLASSETASIAIKDAAGTVLARGVSSGNTQYRSSVGNLQPGTYYLSITTRNKTETLKFVKE